MADQLCDDILQVMPKVLAQKIAKDAIHFSYARTRAKNKIDKSIERKWYESINSERNWLQHQHDDNHNKYQSPKWTCPINCNGVNCTCKCNLCENSYVLSYYVYDNDIYLNEEWYRSKEPIHPLNEMLDFVMSGGIVR